ncbi:hypothetical protein BU24DRAFT_496343 [Aaosphaeria arxii CBS 175.79]|uniref:Uncharacterized protein n=1 Tax=Aaosphaeria arxii CBS 175.79 TaxID=1450172 RepID=A0A6A5XBY1_9PLEO|nr:uncharacterized protein BU24DRAFT_496343 [Aaosphaeria arxii CBS 175.79]KAF2010317.1 hypothetical protein BU24DRAFT_496343 [Aaosphaeria arxii CBS 175.79]
MHLRVMVNVKRNDNSGFTKGFTNLDAGQVGRYKNLNSSVMSNLLINSPLANPSSALLLPLVTSLTSLFDSFSLPAPMAMVVQSSPPLLIRLFNNDEVSGVIPGSLVHSFGALENVCYSIYGVDPNNQLVHFHLEDGICQGVLIPHLWNLGHYFGVDSLRDGKLHLFVHFDQPGAPAYDGFEHAAAELKHRETTLPLSNELQQYPMFDPVLQMALFPDVAHPKPPVDTKPNVQIPLGDGNKYPGLPAYATPEAWDKSFKLFTAKAPPQDSFMHRTRRWTKFTLGVRRRVAHARLIEGSYGVEAPNTCQSCKDLGVACRVYHPAIFGSDFKKLNALKKGTKMCSRCLNKNGSGCEAWGSPSSS